MQSTLQKSNGHSLNNVGVFSDDCHKVTSKYGRKNLSKKCKLMSWGPDFYSSWAGGVRGENWLTKATAI